MIGVQVESCAPFPASLARRRAGRRRLGPDDRRRDRRQAARRPDAGADRALGRPRARRRRGRDRRGDGLPARAGQARRRGRGRGRRGRAARPAWSRRRPGHHGRGPLGRQRRPGPARADRPSPREPGRAPARCCWPGCPTARVRSPSCSPWSASAAPTCSTSSTSARALTSTCARARSSSCSRPAARATPPRWSARVRAAGYDEPRAALRRRRSRASAGGRRDQSDDPAALVGLGVPLDAEHEPPVRAPRSSRASSSSAECPVTVSPSPITSTA